MKKPELQASDKILKILKPEVQEFIIANEQADERKLVLKYKTIQQVPSSWVAEQIAGRRKAKTKLPSWHQAKNIIYPPSVNLEQCSSESTATFKAEILRQHLSSHTTAADLTGGMGVDTLALNTVFDSVDYVEPDADLFHLARHNLSLLKRQGSTLSFFNDLAESFLAKSVGPYDLIYLDPSRRDPSSHKVVRFQDCQPDATVIMPGLFGRTSTVLIKASPLIDLQEGCRGLSQVEKIYVISLHNEMKEVLFLCHHKFTGEPQVHACELSVSAAGGPSIFSFYMQEEKKAIAEFAKPGRYLMEPNAAILKSGAFKLVAARMGLKKIGPNTHLYTSPHAPEHFPGRTFAIEAYLKSDPKEIRNHFQEGKANVMTRNYPLSPDQLRKKVGLRDGGEKFLIGFSGLKEKWLVAATRVA